MTTVKDLAALLDDIQLSEFGTRRLNISDKQLKYFANFKLCHKRYKTFYISKKSGGLREINAPCDQLGILLSLLNILFKNLYSPNSSVIGFTKGCSVVTNAKIHVGHHYIFNTDLKDFFPSISQARVWARLQIPPFCFTKEIANIVAGLCCYRASNDDVGHLPQGAATSPILSNAICDKLDRRMCGVAKRFGLHYSRYADDMSFSSMHNVFQDESECRSEIKRIIEEQGFTMNEKKTRLLRDGVRQEVTGLIVNRVVNVSHQYISDLRWIISVWEREGYAKAYSKFYLKYKKEKGYIKRGEPIMENVISGKLNYLRMVKGSNNKAYKKLQERYNKLQQFVFANNDIKENTSYVYVQPYPIEVFLSDFSASISLEVSNKGKLVGKCVMDGMEKIISISKSTQKLLCSNIDTLVPKTVVTSKNLESCYVTLCRSKGKNFWMITEFKPRRSNCLSLQNINIDMDKLLEVWDKDGVGKATSTLLLQLQRDTIL